MKKLLFICAAVALGYIGYLVWGNLDDREKEVVKDRVDQAAEKTKDLAKSAADKVTGKTKEMIHEHWMGEDQSTALPKK